MPKLDDFAERLVTRGLRRGGERRILEVGAGELVSFTMGDKPQPVPAASYYRRLIRIPGRPITLLCRARDALVVAAVGRTVHTTTLGWQYVLIIESDADDVVTVRSIGVEGWGLIRWKPTGRLADGFIERLLAQQAAHLAELTPEDRAENALNTGGLCNELGDVDGARLAWSTAMEAGGAAGTAAALNLGIMAAQAGDLATARRYYRTAIDCGHPAYTPKAAYNLALLVRDDGDAATAAALLRDAIDSGDSDVSGRAAEALDRLAPGTG